MAWKIARPLLYVAVLVLVALAPSAHAENIRVIEAVFTSGVNDRQYTNRLSGTAPVQPLTFWTKLSADEAALDKLRRELKLPIWHRWTRAVGAMPDPNNERVVDEIPLTVGSTDVFSALEQQIKDSDDKRFTWRTWSRKDEIRSGEWTVSLRYRDGTPVLCNGTPCRYRVKVQPQ